MKQKWNVSLTVLSLFAASLAHAAGREGGNGGDICEDRFTSVRDDIASWIEKGGSASLTFPAGVTLAEYNEQMLKYISDPTDAPKSPFKASIQCVSEKVIVDGAEKTCRNDKNSQSGAASIVCNADRFNKTDDSDQYVLVHHEYAGLAGLEENDGPESKYVISNQISGFLQDEVVKKLAISPSNKTCDQTPCAPPDNHFAEVLDMFNKGNIPQNLTSSNYAGRCYGNPSLKNDPTGLYFDAKASLLHLVNTTQDQGPAFDSPNEIDYSVISGGGNQLDYFDDGSQLNYIDFSDSSIAPTASCVKDNSLYIQWNDETSNISTGTEKLRQYGDFLVFQNAWYFSADNQWRIIETCYYFKKLQQPQL